MEVTPTSIRPFDSWNWNCKRGEVIQQWDPVDQNPAPVLFIKEPVKQHGHVLYVQSVADRFWLEKHRCHAVVVRGFFYWLVSRWGKKFLSTPLAEKAVKKTNPRIFLYQEDGLAFQVFNNFTQLTTIIYVIIDSVIAQKKLKLFNLIHTRLIAFSTLVLSCPNVKRSHRLRVTRSSSTRECPTASWVPKYRDPRF